MKEGNYSSMFFLAMFLLLLYLIGKLAWPFITPIIFAGIIAGSLNPLLGYVTGKYSLSRKWTSVFICIMVVISIVLPSFYLTMQLSKEALALYEFLKDNFTEENITKFLFEGNYFSGILRDLFGMAKIEYSVASMQKLILESAKHISSGLFDFVNRWIANIFDFLLQFILMLLIIYEFLADGPAIKRFIFDLSPLPEEEEELVLQKFNQMNFVTLVGNGLGGLIQGVTAGIGFWIAGIESIMLWTTSMVLLAFIPLVGISIIYVPACVYLFVVGKTIGSICLFVYCTLVSLIVENWFKPEFVGNRVRINSTLVFFSIIGGLSVFGIPGIFYGPLIVSIFLTFVGLYHKRYTQ